MLPASPSVYGEIARVTNGWRALTKPLVAGQPETPAHELRTAGGPLARGANVEVVRDGVEGLQAATAGQWEEMLIELARDPALRRRLGHAARARVESAYSVRAVLPKYLDVLRAVT